MKILVVEDSNDNLILFKEILERKGFEVETALNGEEALQILRKTPVNLILSDILMPVMDGFRLLQECKSDSKLKKIPFVFITGTFLDKKDEDLALKTGVKAFIRKPVEPNKLISLVDDILTQTKAPKKASKTKISKSEIDRELNISLVEKLQARMHDLEEEIADRHKAESALKQAEAEFRLLFDTMSQGVTYQDSSGNIISANRAAERILGLSQIQLIGRNFTDPRWKAIREDGSDFPGDTHPTMIAHSTGQPVKDVMMGIYNPADEVYRWIKVDAVPQFRPGEDKPYLVYAIFEDITDQFLSLKALQEHEARQHAVLENTADAIFSFDRDLRITAANEASKKVYQLIAGTERIFEVGDNILEFTPSEFRDYWVTVFNQALRGKRQVFEKHYDTSQGPVDVEISVNPIVSPSQEITGFSVFGRDITGRKHAEQQLRESEQYYRTLIEYAAESIYVVQKGRIVFARSGPSPITGYTSEELIGKSASDLLHPDDYHASAADYESERSSAGPSHKKYVFRVIDKSGAIKWVQAHVTDITWEGKPAALTFQTDITEHKQLEEAIRKSNRLYRMLYECNEAVVKASTEQMLLQNICNVMVDTGGYFMVWIGSAENDADKTVRPLTYCGHMDDYLESIKFSWADEEMGKDPTGKAIRSGTTIVNQDITQDPDFTHWLEQSRQQGYTAIIALPLKSYWQTIGALTIYSSTANSFDQNEINLLEQLAADVAYGITSLRERGQREKAEEALRESEQRFRKALQSTTDVVWDWNISSGDLDWYGDIDGMLGYSDVLLPRTRAAWESILDAADHDRVMATLDRLAQTGEPYNIEYRIHHKDSTLRTFIDRGLALRDRDGNIIRAVGACVDITNRRLEDARVRIRRDLAINLAATSSLNEALQQSLEAAIKISGMESGAIYLLDYKTGNYNLVHYRDISASTMEQFSTLYAGSGDAELISKGNPVYTPADMFTSRYKKPFTEEGWTFTATLPVMHNGTAVACFLIGSHHLSRLDSVTRDSLVTIAADIGMAIERIGSREALQAGEERLRFITDHTKDVIWVLDKDLHTTYISPSVTLQRGYTVDEALQLDFTQLFAPGYLEIAANTVLGNIPAGNALETAQANTFTLDIQLRRKDGTTFWSEESVTVLSTPDGEFDGMLGISRDITDRKKLESELREKEEMFRVVFNHHYQFTGLLDHEGHVLAINSAALRFADMTDEQVTGKYFWETAWWQHSVEAQDQLKSAIAKAAQGEFIHYLTTNIDAQNELRQIDFTLSPVQDDSGNVIYMVPEGRDITDTVTAQNALKESEEKYRLVVESANEGIFVAQDGRLKFYNTRVSEISGYKMDELREKPFAEIIHPSDREMVIDRHLRRLGGEAFEDIYTFRIITKQGTTTWIALAAVMINWEGRPATLNFVNDITERKQAEDALRDSEEKYRLVVENAREGIIVLQDAYARFVNQYIPALLGYSRDYILSQPFLEYIHADERQTVTERYRHRISGEDIYEPLIIRLKAADGSYIWVEIRAVWIEWEGQPATLNFMTDITQRKQAEDALHDSEEKYRSILEQMDDAYFKIDSRGNFTFFNDVLTRHLRYTREELIGLNYKAYIPPEDIKRAVEIFSEVFRTGKPRQDVPLVIICKDGTRIYIEDSIYPVRDEKGEIIGLRNLGRNVTDRRKAEQELQMRAFLLDSTYDTIIAYKPDGTIVYANETAAGTRGYTIEEMLQMDIRQLLPARNIPMFEERLQKVIDSGSLTFEAMHVRKDGSEFYVEAQARLIDVAGEKTVIVVYRDITDHKKTESKLSEALETITSTLEGTMEAITMMSELRDPYTAGHQKMVTLLALAIAKEMGLPEDQSRGLRVAGLLHDVGKVYVPSEILSKPGKLSDLEKGLAKAHAAAGYDIVKTIRFPWPVDEMVRQHHERMDGSGYPRGLKGEEIMLEARILAVADTVEAMMSHRPYRAALGMDKALEEITTNRGILYDVKVVDACLSLFREKGFEFPE
ncbi:MAG: PAS domain S-box protein [Dehalococcoidia bacterium]|nr:PAS domain S-box protein [Dehalococcoidia bacterium]